MAYRQAMKAWLRDFILQRNGDFENSKLKKQNVKFKCKVFYINASMNCHCEESPAKDRDDEAISSKLANCVEMASSRFHRD